METRFIQIHTLVSYPASLLNRDDAGFAKRIPFGGASRTRISSQCLKRHWRTAEGEHALSGLDVPASVRSRLSFEKFVVRPCLESGMPEPVVRTVAQAYADEVLGASDKKKGEPSEADESTAAVLETGQVTVLGRPELSFIEMQVRKSVVELQASGVPKKPDVLGKDEVKKVREVVKKTLTADARKNLVALRLGAGLDAAVFGRMVTSDALARCDAAVHVAHSFTVHVEAAESDYFSAVDDLRRAESGDLGSGHINSTELTTGLFYGYVVVDVPLLVSNLEGCPAGDAAKADRKLAGGVVERLVQLVATVSPGAKLGSTAPYAHAHLVLVEMGKAQPRTLANAFLRPVADHPDLVENAYRAIGTHLAELDRMYGGPAGRKLAGIGPLGALGAVGEAAKTASLAELAGWAAHGVREG
jgi:CRISPR system Cascade subunit CasC